MTYIFDNICFSYMNDTIDYLDYGYFWIRHFTHQSSIKLNSPDLHGSVEPREDSIISGNILKGLVTSSDLRVEVMPLSQV